MVTIPKTKVAIQREQTGDVSRDRSQALAIELASKIRGCPFLDGVLIRNVSIGTADLPVSHGLGRTLTGYIVTKTRGAASILRLSDVQPIESINRCSMVGSAVGGIFDIWFF